jgi:hypothetical protein
MGRLSTSNNPTEARDILKDMIAAGFELGYTSAELQLESKFLAPEDEDDGNPDSDTN